MYPKAETYLRQALDADPKHLDTQVLLGRVLTRQGKTEEGLELLARAADDHPDSPNVFYVLATLYQQLGKENEAREAGERFQRLTKEAEERDHRDARVKVTYKSARELLTAGKVAESEGGFESVLEIDPDNVEARSMLAKIAYSKGDLASAQKWIDEALEKDDAVAESHYLNALFATKSGDRVRGESSARRSLELMPGSPDAWMLLGSILADSDRPAEAVDCYVKAAALEPSDPTNQLNLASAYHALGKLQEEDQAMARYRELTTTRKVNQ
jgi:predicted Zn-dependent protease